MFLFCPDRQIALMLQKKLHEAFQVQMFARSVDWSLVQIFRCCHFSQRYSLKTQRRPTTYTRCDCINWHFTVFRRLKHSNVTLHKSFFWHQNSVMFPIWSNICYNLVLLSLLRLSLCLQAFVDNKLGSMSYLVSLPIKVQNKQLSNNQRRSVIIT